MQTTVEEKLQAALKTSGEMLAAVYRGVNDVRVETVPVPQIGKGELLVRIHTCGICGTDLKKIATGSHSAPRIFGHETAGVVIAAGMGTSTAVGIPGVVFLMDFYSRYAQLASSSVSL